MIKLIKYLAKSFMSTFRPSFHASRKATKEAIIHSSLSKSHKKIAEDLFNTASMQLAEHGHFYPTFFMVKDDKYIPVMMHPGSDEIDLATYASIVNSAAQDEDVDAVILISEQWTVIGKINDEEMKAYEEGIKKPSEAEGRSDFLNLVYISACGDVRSISGKIKKSPHGIMYIDGYDWMDSATTNVITPWKLGA